MEVLKPTLIYIGGRCYRKNPIQGAENFEEEEILHTEDRTYEDEVCDAFTNIEETENGYRIRLETASAFFKYIIGKKGETKKRLENETRTQIKIPKFGEEGDIVILGRDKKGVLSAKTRIELLVDSARQRQQFTHFLSFPVAGQEFKDRLAEFKEDVLRQCDGDRGLDGSIFQNEGKLHFTIGTLVLLSKKEIEQACAILEECKQELIRPILGTDPLVVHFRGLEYMNDDPGEVDVLYAKAELPGGSEKLQILADRLVEKFASAGLMRREYDRVKLHVTVMNTLYRKDPDGASHNTESRGRPRESFNAANVLRIFGDYDFGHHHINTLHLSQLHSTAPDGYYGHAGRIDLP